MKSDHDFINLSQGHEIDYALRVYDIERNSKNRFVLVSLIERKIKPYFNIPSSGNLKWKQLHEYFEKHNIKANWDAVSKEFADFLD